MLLLTGVPIYDDEDESKLVALVPCPFVKMARSLKLPMVRLIEGAGGSIKEILEIGYTELPSSGDECAQDRVEVMSEIPVIFRHLCSTFQLNTIHAVFRIRLLPNPHFPIVLN